MEFLEKMWTNHRTATIIVGVLLLPITLAIIGLKIYMALNMKAAENSLKDAQKTDDKLAAKEDELKKQADAAVAAADKAAQRIENRHEDGAVDMDWHTKRKD
jgi:hypothetical protein